MELEFEPISKVEEYTPDVWICNGNQSMEPKYTDNIYETNIIKMTTTTPEGEKVEYNYSFKLGTQKFDFHSTVLYKEVIVSEPSLDIETCVDIVPEVKNWIDVLDSKTNKRIRYNLMPHAKSNVINRSEVEEIDPFDLPF